MNKFKPLSLDAELENVMGYVYITYGPECEEFDSTNAKVHRTVQLCTTNYLHTISMNTRMWLMCMSCTIHT